MSRSTRVRIKPFYPRVTMDADYADTTWELLHKAIKEIHRKNASGLSFEELYRNAYNMVLHKHGDSLYNGLRKTVNDHLKDTSETVSLANDEDLLFAVHEAWEDHTQSMLMIRDILMYMDRIYVQHNNVPSVYDLGLQLFRENIARNEKIKDRVLYSLLSSIDNERKGLVIDKGLIKSITQMLVDLGVNTRTVYEEDFEQYFLEESANFYRIESQGFIAENSAPEYMKKVEARIDEEMERVNSYLDQSTEAKIQEVVERELITSHLETLVHMENSGLIPMLRDDKMDDIRRMYYLLKRTAEGHPLMREVISEYVKETGKSIVEHPDNEKRTNPFIQALIELKDKYDAILSQATNDDKHFILTVNQAFESFINAHPRSPEFISMFIDDKLKKGLRGSSEDEIEEVLKKVMILFRFIMDKDVFEKYYKQHLAKRLLLGRSVSDDAETMMIQKLKTECGKQFTAKLEGMFNDMKSSASTMDEYKEYILNIAENEGSHIDMNVNVLTTGYWPTQPAASCNLPNVIQMCCTLFEDFYLRKHTGRVLRWQTTMGTAELRAQFNKRHELNVSTYQMCILLLFNEQDKLSFQQIQEQTGIAAPDLRRNLFSLSCGKFRILLKEPKTRKLTPKDTFQFNPKFRSKLFRVKVIAPSAPSSDQRSRISKKILEDRKHLIEAAIVRVMKARNRLDHNQLLAEVIKQLSSRFQPHVNIIKKRVESLIDREYLERDKADRRMYVYLA
eukprot:TRINITY_DN9707_c0_g1_i1.p1 TRINITY_DN9707_c0_g1~~TRINITY_DN9707_c0_g1_i1.p1  ORF type:complete len:747 (-),score=159.93 TRINITY_DN9707_c0_g1_i1:273-2471(-)